MTKRKTDSIVVSFSSPEELGQVFGPDFQYLDYLRRQVPTKIIVHKAKVRLVGSMVEIRQCEYVIQRLRAIARKRESISNDLIESLLDAGAAKAATEEVAQPARVRAKSRGQAQYLEALAAHELTFALGPAGTGKTYLATAMAVQYLLAKQVSKIILTRPIVEAGESLGFLPGGVEDKVAPYFRPLYDALDHLLGPERTKRSIEAGIIEVAPLAYMRGRTLRNAYIILDEAQNTTPSQMKMFLTRFGEGSRMVITGDPSQNDLPFNQSSGLLEAAARCAAIPAVGIVRLDRSDVIRHPLVQAIIDVYEDG